MNDLIGPNRLDLVEKAIVESGGVVRQRGGSVDWAPVTHRFTPGMYIREIFMPAGALIVSATHKTEHPYVISQGVVSVYIDGSHAETLIAPHTGITKPGTRRLLYIHEDTIWTTFHVTRLTDPAEIEAEILEPHENPLLRLEAGV